MNQRMSRRSVLKLTSATVATAFLSGCGLSSGSTVPLPVGPGSIRPIPELEGVPITVGSKEFTEQILLGYIAEFALVAAGAEVRDLTNITGSASARNALASNQIDVLWEYTGSSWVSYNGRSEVIPDAIEQYEAVRKLDLESNGIAWTALSRNSDNTYALAVNQEVAQRLGVSKLSDIKRVAEQTPDQATFCVESEFATRNDGLPGVAKTYGFTPDPSKIETLSAGTIYAAVSSAKSCNFGEVYTTDGRVEAQNLKLLADDKAFFPRYNLGITLRADMLERYPQITQVFQPISDRLNNVELMALNKQIDVEGRDPADAARDWMVRQGFVSAPDKR